MEDEFINNEVHERSEFNDNNDLFDNITRQLSFLNDKFKVYENLGGDQVTIDHNENSQSDNKYLSDITLGINNSENLYVQLKEKEIILNRLREEFNDSEKDFECKLKEKDLIIENLRKELDMMKCERNESINQMQNIFKGVDGAKNKFTIFNLRKAGGLHSHQNSLTSMSSLSTYHDDKQIDKINNEKLIIEKQLVEYKFKYAETSAKLNELEGEFEKLHLNFNDLTEKMKSKELIIKKISEERDHYKYNTSAHYSVNSITYHPPKINSKKLETVQLKRTSPDDMQIMDNYINTEPGVELKQSSNSTSSSRSGSIIKYIKNIFKSVK